MYLLEWKLCIDSRLDLISLCFILHAKLNFHRKKTHIASITCRIEELHLLIIPMDSKNNKLVYLYPMVPVGSVVR